ncbi:hypothetical protein COOONC_14645 [Cooperia oncophora]
MAVRDGEKQRVSGHWSAVPSRQEEIVEKSAKQVPSAAAPPEQPAEAVQPPQVAQLSEQPTKAAPQPESTPVPPPRKHVPKEQEVPVPITRQMSGTEEETQTEKERKVRLVAVKFAETFTESVMSQARAEACSQSRSG